MSGMLVLPSSAGVRVIPIPKKTNAQGVFDLLHPAHAVIKDGDFGETHVVLRSSKGANIVHVGYYDPQVREFGVGEGDLGHTAYVKQLISGGTLAERVLEQLNQELIGLRSVLR